MPIIASVGAGFTGATMIRVPSKHSNKVAVFDGRQALTRIAMRR